MFEIPILDELHARGLIAQCTDLPGLARQLAKGPITLYCGFDPTADSLHVGSLIPLLTLRRFQLAGHRPVALVGGATGLIGDPSFKATERRLNEPEVVQAWTDKLRKQIENLLDFDGPSGAVVVNNHDWLGTMHLLPFLRDVGKHFSVNAMMRKDTVQKRLDRDDSGISFAEFSYALLQAQDFIELHTRHACVLQIGGSDQWGNIVGGIDLGRRVARAKLFGLTQPLITRADGGKFGKSEAGTIWLDAQRTSPYAFHQYWLSIPDIDVFRYLRQFTFLTRREIEDAQVAAKSSSNRSEGQRILADCVTAIVHGKQARDCAVRIAESLFRGAMENLSRTDLAQLALDGLTSVKLATRTHTTCVDALVECGLANSRTEGRQLVANGAVKINGATVRTADVVLTCAGALYGAYTLLQRGKRAHAVLDWTG